MSRLTYMLLAVVAIYAVTSVAVALATAEKCGTMDSPKSWRVVPPEWVCG